jgi:hypothetical protein
MSSNNSSPSPSDVVITFINSIITNLSPTTPPTNNQMLAEEPTKTVLDTPLSSVLSLEEVDTTRSEPPESTDYFFFFKYNLFLPFAE